VRAGVLTLRISVRPQHPAQTSSAPAGIPVAAGFSVFKTDDGKFVVTDIASDAAAIRRSMQVGDIIVQFGDHVFSPSDSLDRAALLFDAFTTKGVQNNGDWPTSAGKQLVVSRQTGPRSSMLFKIRIQPPRHDPQYQVAPAITRYLSEAEVAHSRRARDLYHSAGRHAALRTPNFSVSPETEHWPRALTPPQNYQSDDMTQDNSCNSADEIFHEMTPSASIRYDLSDSDGTEELSLTSSLARRPVAVQQTAAEISPASVAAAVPQKTAIPGLNSTLPDETIAPGRAVTTIAASQSLAPSLSNSTTAGTTQQRAAEIRSNCDSRIIAAAFSERPKPSKLEPPLSTPSLQNMMFAQRPPDESEKRPDIAIDLKNPNTSMAGETWKKSMRNRVALDFGAAFRRKEAVAAHSGSVERDNISWKKLLFG
jgi:hypothetical protein